MNIIMIEGDEDGLGAVSNYKPIGDFAEGVQYAVFEIEVYGKPERIVSVQKGVKLSIHQWWRRAIGGILPMLGLLMISTADADIVGARLDPTRAEVVQSAMIDQLGATGSAALEDTRHPALIDRAWSQGAIPVIVLTDKTEARDGSPAPRLLGMLGLGTGRDRAGAPVKVFSQLDGFAMRADALDLLDLLDDPSVVGVVEDVAYSPDVLESVPLLGASFSNFGGFNGSGQTVAILDTGFDRAHPMLSGKIVAEGCYSTHVPSNGVYSLCPGEVGESVATGSSAACSEADWGVNCGHGTHVAGIAVGNSSYYKGVASGASLIAIQVFSGFTSSACGGSPCVMAYLSDIIKGLERVEALRQQYAIASVNLSLGGGAFSDHCDDYPAKPVIDRLRTAGIASVMSAGNSGHLNAVGAPACVSSAISVGASCDYQAGALCTEVDAVASYSNRAAILSLLAPGSAITSALPGGRYEAWHGTSMAAPHVAGAWAVLKQAKPTVSVEEALAALKMSGRLVQDGASGLTLARIRPAAAIEILGQGQIDPPENESGLPPAVPTDLGSMNVTRNGFTLKWNSVPGASGYQIDILRYWNFSWMLDGYRNLDVGAATQWNVSGLQAGITYFVRVRAYNDYGTSVDSAVLMIRTPRF